jgi:hypothetical protein
LPFSTHAGGSSDSERLSVRRSKGLCGAIAGAKSAATTHSRNTASESMATGECRKLHATSPSQPARSLA